MDDAALRAWTRGATPPDASYVSRSYRFPYALVAWHTEPLGVDIERVEPFDAAFLASICTPDERAAVARLEEPDACVASLWSSKEALSKALGDPLRYDPRRLDSPMRWPDGRCGPWRAAEIAAPPGHTAWLCWRSS
jgi:phosphopantetheinyl transferase